MGQSNVVFRQWRELALAPTISTVPLIDARSEEVIAGLESAWAFFGGIPRYLVMDNFPAALAGPDALHPRLTRGFLEYAQHRSVICDPARVRHPKDKPKVERDIQYVRERFFKDGES